MDVHRFIVACNTAITLKDVCKLVLGVDKTSHWRIEKDFGLKGRSMIELNGFIGRQQAIGLDEWNDDALWRAEYQGMADGCLFFAEDVFGGQFCVRDGKVFTFDPETGALEYLADDIEGWAAAIVGDYDVLTGYPLAHQWQSRNAQLPAGKRLLPKTPFVAGGEFNLDNLYLVDAVKGMKFRADIANQIRNLPDGAQIRFDVVD